MGGVEQAVGGYGVQVTLVLVLVLVNAVFAGSEMALVSLRESQLERLERTSRGGRVLARLARDPNRFLATIQIGITLAGFLASAAAAVSLAQPLVEPLGFLGGAAEPASIVVVTILLTFVTLVLGELAPKRIAMQRAEGWALLVARPLDALSTVSRPAVWLLSAASDAVVRMTGGDPGARREEVTTEELRDMVAAQRNLTPEHRMIISGAFEVAERVLREILVPRRDVVTLSDSLSAPQALRELGASGQTRAPVVGRGGLDDTVGLVHMRDLLDQEGPVAAYVSPPLYLPETLKVTEAIREMRQQRQQFALVVDERGAIDGIVTMEDLVEEIVGEIYDETDRDVQSVIREPDGALLMPGGFPLHDLPDVGVDLPDDLLEAGDYTTVAGLVLAQLGHIPKAPGEVVELPGLTAEVTEVSGRAIARVRLRSAPPGIGAHEAA
ncbi:hemolysin family protein [Verrucosispora sp. WMMC514]|uniref:hemolysin family protein n=1 Tax=Verrucosispora sp. WMMC514 TaxID=3015156 RepID=UPI00248AF44E|nr:hemolysin family protein [Verrucosispora sp. WMMC514]WBB93247.1 hemolysin family protein [Verrucosispora sp. WMMC514]